MLVVANLTITKCFKQPEKSPKPCCMGTQPRVHGESYPMNTKTTGLGGFHKYLHPCSLDESSLSIKRVNWAFISVACLAISVGVGGHYQV